MNLDQEYDFGFTTHSQEEISSDKITELEGRLEEMYNLIIPLLNNLAKDSDRNPIINWPNRKTKIEEFISKLDEILTRT